MFYVKCFPSKSILERLFFLYENNLYVLNFFKRSINYTVLGAMLIYTLGIHLKFLTSSTFYFLIQWNYEDRISMTQLISWLKGVIISQTS